MGINRADVQMVNDSLGDLTRSLTEKRRREQEAENQRMRNDVDQQHLGIQRQGLSNTAAYQDKMLTSQQKRYDEATAHEGRMEKVGEANAKTTQDYHSDLMKHQATQQALTQLDNAYKQLETGVKNGTISHATANAKARQIVDNIKNSSDAILQNSPFAALVGGDEDLFQDPAPPEPDEKIVGPDGTIILRRGKSSVHAGYDPLIRKRATENAEKQWAQEDRAVTDASTNQKQISDMEAAIEPKRKDVGSFNPRDVFSLLPGVNTDQQEVARMEKELAAKRGAQGGLVQPSPITPPGAPATPTAAPTNPGAATPQGAVARPMTRAEAQALPPGTRFINPADGKIYIKHAGAQPQ